MDKRLKSIGLVTVIATSSFFIWGVAAKFVLAIVVSVLLIGGFVFYAYEQKYSNFEHIDEADAAEEDTSQRSTITIPITIALIVFLTAIIALVIFVR